MINSMTMTTTLNIINPSKTINSRNSIRNKYHLNPPTITSIRIIWSDGTVLESRWCWWTWPLEIIPTPTEDLDLPITDNYTPLELSNTRSLEERKQILQQELNTLNTQINYEQQDLEIQTIELNHNLEQARQKYNNLDWTWKTLVEFPEQTNKKQEAIKYTLQTQTPVIHNWYIEEENLNLSSLPSQTDINSWKTELTTQEQELQNEIQQLKQELEKKQKIYEQKISRIPTSKNRIWTR